MWHIQSCFTWLLPYKFDTDDRQPVLTFHWSGSMFGVYMFSLVWWIEIVVWVVTLSILMTAASHIVYNWIILPTKRNKVGQSSFSLTEFVIGFGFFIPIWLVLPYFILHILDVRSCVMRFLLGAIVPTLSLFRTLAAIYGFVPDHASRSVSDFAMYFGSPLVIKFENLNYRKASIPHILAKLARFGLYLVTLGIYQSFLSLYPFLMPLGSVPASSSDWYSFRQVLSVNQMGNNLAHAVLFQMYLTTFCEGLEAVTAILTGFESEVVMRNPVFQSKSPTDFWSRRWNLLVHGVLKRGIYLPVRHCFRMPREIAALATFLASGLFHEWLNHYVFQSTNFECIRSNDGSNISNPSSPAPCFVLIYGGSIGFMLWQSMLVALEWGIGHWNIFSHVKRFPILQSFTIILLGLPLAHWFCEPYIRSSFFTHGQLALPMILKIHPASI